MVAECRFGRGAKDLFDREQATRLSMAEWMIEHGSDVHQGNDGPLMRAALSGNRIPMMELLMKYGADVNAVWHGEFPIIFSPCETQDPVALRWLLEHGANPNCNNPARKHPGTALDYVIGSYLRSSRLGACLEMLVAAGGTTKYAVPPVLDIMSGRMDLLKARLDADSTLTEKRFPDLDFGTAGGRMLTLRGATLLHVEAEYQNLEAAMLLLSRGTDVNAPSDLDESGFGGQTPVFHAVTQRRDAGILMATLLIEHGADLSVRARVPGHYERIGETLSAHRWGTLGPSRMNQALGTRRRL
jgi:ankyrin repeat protein